eukprot:CAMPEP_0174702038 /NCGR_PEP_ID=MMETSP1094-20130205/6466_1 /TAXON_ID=156173 /ORGANISM="Chrysochromulina brevifilum, Strain UTEX LB 985" /LENGTH=58 /DNA_ID=CAMNT_0015899761 /DNA_START=476 /DNA_END=652 /DNA_ORIENTATION=-
MSVKGNAEKSPPQKSVRPPAGNAEFTRAVQPKANDMMMHGMACAAMILPRWPLNASDG